jgi:hypothetical protein
MKKTLVTFAVIGVSALTVLGQARVAFQNINNYFGTGQGAVTIGTPANPPATGQYVGSDYSIQLLWKAGTFADLASFLAASPSSSSPVAFFGTTGGDPTTGAGIFDGGTVALGGPAGTYTFLAQAWYNGGTYSTYDAAATAGKNVGRSVLFQIAATEPPTPQKFTDFPSFTVQAIPEPATLALGGLGLATLFVLRRRS